MFDVTSLPVPSTCWPCDGPSMCSTSCGAQNVQFLTLLLVQSLVRYIEQPVRLPITQWSSVQWSNPPCQRM